MVLNIKTFLMRKYLQLKKKNYKGDSLSSESNPMVKLLKLDQSERQNWMNNLIELKNKKCFVDGTIETSDHKTFKIDRNILAAGSRYFKSLFTNVLDPENQVNEVYFPDIRSDIMEMIINFIYTGQLHSVTVDNFESLLRAVDRLEVNGVLSKCYSYLIDSINFQNCIQIYQLATSYSIVPVIEASKLFILHNFVLISKENFDFSKLSSDEMIELLKDDRLNVSNEDQTYQALMSWISFDKKRVFHFDKLFKLIRLGNATLQFVQTTIRDNFLVNSNSEMKNYIDKVEEILIDIQRDPSPKKFLPDVHFFLRPRIPRDIIFTFGGWSTANACNYVETYDCRVNKWYMLEEIDPKCKFMSPYRAYHGMVYLNGLIYIIGGFNGNAYFNSVETFDPVTRQWNDKSCMHVPRCYVSVAECNGYIYAMGGYDGNIRTSSVEMYDPKMNQWKFVTDMNHARSDASATCFNGKIYIVGGFNGNDVLNSVEVYDPELNVWSLIAEMNRPRSGVQLIVYDQHLYVLAGNDGVTRQTTVERYSVVEDRWRVVTNMRTPRSNFACVVLEGYIYIIGGFNGVTTIDEVEKYDPISNTWQEVWKMNVHRSALNACVVSGLENAKEYTWLRNEMIQNNELPYISMRRQSGTTRHYSA